MRTLTISHLAFCVLSGVGYSQTKISLRDQANTIDFAAATFTRPVKTGTALPATCNVGDLFFQTTATPGQNLFACTAVNNWTVQAVPGDSLPSTGGNEGAILSVSGGSATWVQPGGDISGPLNTARVTSLQNRPVADINPSTGMALIWNGSAGRWEPQTISGGGGGEGGPVTVQTDGSLVGSRSILNWTPGIGLTNLLTDTGTTVQIQQSVDTAVIQSRANTQSGQTLYCSSGSASTSSYTCSLSPVLTAYTTGMVVHWRPDVSSSGGAVTLSIDTLPAKSVLRADGATNPGASEIVGGQLYALWYDGTAFRLPEGAGGASAGVQKDGPYLQLGASRYLMPGMYEVNKPDTFTWSDASSGGSWSTLEGGARALVAAAGGGANWRIRYTNRAASNTLTFAVQCLAQGDSSGNSRCAVFLRENSSGRLMLVEFARQEHLNASNVQAGCWTNPASYSGTTLFNGSATPLSNNLAYVRLQFAAGNIAFQVSQSGLAGTWMQMGSWSQTACGMSTAPDQVGVAAMASNAVGSGDTVLTVLSLKAE